MTIMNRYTLQLLALYLLVTSCVPIKTTELTFNNRGPSSISLQKQLWMNNCANCHTNANSGLPTKIYSTENDIQVAIINQDSMKNLSHLTFDEVKYIADYLNNESLREAQSIVNDQKASSQIVIGTKSYLKSKLTALFIGQANSSSNGQVSNIINTLDQYPGALGGTCVFNQEFCQGVDSDNINAKMNAATSVTRRGIIIKVCRQIHDLNSVILNSLEYSGLSANDLGTDTNLRKLMDMYMPSETDQNNVILKEIKKGYQGVISSNGSKEQAWNMVSYILCSSTAFEKI